MKFEISADSFNKSVKYIKEWVNSKRSIYISEKAGECIGFQESFWSTM